MNGYEPDEDGLIHVTPEMVEAGLEELRDYRIGGDQEDLVRQIFYAMAYESFSASSTKDSM